MLISGRRRRLLIEVYPLPAEEARIHRECSGTDESKPGADRAQQNAGTHIVMLHEDTEDRNRDDEESGNWSPQPRDEQCPICDREKAKNSGGISAVPG